MALPSTQEPAPATVAVDIDAVAQQLSPKAPKHRAVRQLCELLAAQHAETPLAGRLDALERLAQWVRARGKLPAMGDAQPAELDPRSARFTLLVRALELVPEWRLAFASHLGSVLADTSGLQLFCETGLPSDRGFVGEAVTRWARRWLPAPRNDADLSELVWRLFPAERDAAWLEKVAPELCARFAALPADPRAHEDPWRPLRNSVADAIALLATRISALGLAADIRSRSPSAVLRESPMFRLPRACDALVDAVRDEDGAPQSLRFRGASGTCKTLDAECRAVVAKVFENLETAGVSVDVVYRLDLITRSLDRLEVLLELILPATSEERCRGATLLVSELIRSRLRDKSILALVRANMQLLARKIIERAGHTGEHYITVSRGEYWKMLASAGGGGILTAGTAALKFLIGWAKLPFFLEGALSATNYAGSFLVMQLCGFTLATKQPSMTAAALAGALRETSARQDLGPLVTQIARITRSQFAAAMGNIGMVIPSAIGLDFAYQTYFGKHFLDEETAHYVLHSLHPTQSGTIFYAALTGVLLWSASVAAGWLENWAVYERLPEAIAGHRIGRLIGTRATGWASRAFSRNISGFGGNVTLGVLLGMTPVMGKFFGLPIDVRHVTLSTGALALAGCSLGSHAIGEPEFVGAMVGIAVIGVLNFNVSFVLALALALRARGATSGDRFRLLLAVLRRVVTHPFEFVFPPAHEKSAAAH